MISSHRFVPLAQAEPGMVLSDNLLDAYGKILLPAGATLSRDILARLPAHGIESLPIALPEEAKAPIDRAAVMQRIAHIFRKTDPYDPALFTTRQLRRFIEDYRLRETGE